MLKLKKTAAVAMGVAMLMALFTGCGSEDEDSSSKEKDSSSSAESSDNSGVAQADPNFDPSSLKLTNFTPPEKGEEIIVMTLKDRGDVKIKLFPKQADKGVENFTGLAKKGYYDGLIFHRIIKDFMVQGGDPEGTGMGGESIWGEKFDGGVSDELHHVAGAVAYANSGSTATNGSQFYIVTGTTYDEVTLNQLADQGLVFPEDAMKAYENLGGAPWLDGSYTIFGQVFDGLDKVFDMQNVETDEMDKPKKDVVIEKITVEKYDGEDVKFFMSDYK